MCIQLDEGEAPMFDPSRPPQKIGQTRRIGDRLCVAGEGPVNADIVFIANSVQEEEVMETVNTVHGADIKSKPRMMKGPCGAMFKDLVRGVGIDVDEKVFYTALCRWLLPRQHRSKPKKEDIAWGKDMLFHELRTVKPKIIVTMGKVVFDLLMAGSMKLSVNDIEGGWFRCEAFDCWVYYMPDLFQLLVRPEKYERFRIDMLQVRRMYDEVQGIAVNRVPEHYRVINNSRELRQLVEEWKHGDYRLFAVDAEWGGTQVIDCRIRSVQFAWLPGHAAYIKFMDEHKNYTFDISYEEVGKILGEHLDKEEVKYAGHHLSVDLTVLAYWLKMKWYKKGFIDTEFAQQTADEYARLGLDSLGMKFTDKGRWDLDLLLWKKANKLDPDEGYGTIPDSILIPYALRDADVTFQSVPFLVQSLVQQDLWNYYQTTFNPFVTDVFTNFSLVGLPMDIPKMDELRSLFSFCRDRMNEEFQVAIREEAEQIFCREMQKMFGDGGGKILMMRLKELVDEGNHQEAFMFLKDIVGPQNLMRFEPFFDHYVQAPRFNIRAPEMMRRWLFTVKGYTPVKSTNNKEKGMPSTSWDRVLGYPPDKQREFTPSVDKQTLQILSEQQRDEVLYRLLELNAVGNLCKAFLKEPEIDEETGEVTRENGLHFWVASDLRVHGQMSTTETGRPRSWKPNSLNWPSYVNERIEKGIASLLMKLNDEGRLPLEFHRYIPGIIDYLSGKSKKTGIPSIRSVVKAPDGWIMVESDYQTAEIRGLAFVSGDENMIYLVCEPDPNFGILASDKKTVVRLSYDPNSGVTVENQHDCFILGKLTKDDNGMDQWVKVTTDDLLRKSDGSLVHPKNDLHWSLAEMVQGKPREMLNDKKDRGAAKVGNFSSAYGATPATLERKIEADTGIKPEPGTGQRILDALAKRQPVADTYLKDIEQVPKYPGFIRAASGRLRRFIGHPDNILGISNRMREGVYNTAGREARNFEMQESVAATAATAGVEILDFAVQNNLEGRPITILYDSVVTLCPLHERFIFTKAHTLYMFLKTGWWYHKRVLRYPIDNELNPAWSSPDKSKQAQYDDVTYCPTPEHLKPLEQWLDASIEYYKNNDWASVRNPAAMKKAMAAMAA